MLRWLFLFAERAGKRSGEVGILKVFGELIHGDIKAIRNQMCIRDSYPLDVHADIIFNAAVGQGFHHAEVGIMQSGVLAYQSDVHCTHHSFGALHHVFPFGEVGIGVRQAQPLAAKMPGNGPFFGKSNDELIWSPGGRRI